MRLASATQPLDMPSTLPSQPPDVPLWWLSSSSSILYELSAMSSQESLSLSQTSVGDYLSNRGMYYLSYLHDVEVIADAHNAQDHVFRNHRILKT